MKEVVINSFIKCFYFSIIIVSIMGINLNAQNKNFTSKHDSLVTKLKNDSLHIYRFQKYRPYINIDQRNSFIRSAPINVNGIQLGVLINEKHILGVGIYSITAISHQKVNTKNNNIDVNRELDMKYATAFYQYILIDKRFFELDMQAEFGGGNYQIKLTDNKTDKMLSNRSSYLLICGIGPLIAIKPTKWVGLAAMGGYRFTFEKNPNLNFNGFFYGYGAWLDIRQIIRDINYKLVKKKKYRKEIQRLQK